MTQSRISSFISRAIAISLLLAVVATPLAAQSKKPRVIQEADTVSLFRGVAVSADMVGLLQKAVSSYGQYEAALRVNLKDKYFPVLELGYGMADATDYTTSMSYKTNAPYARIGVDFNLLRNKHDIYRAYAGFRYACTYYKFDIKGDGITDPVWGDEVPFSVTGVSANYHWLEGVFGVDAKIVGPLRLGWSVRYRFRVAHNDGDVGNTWYVPGYGKQGGTRLGGTFNIIFEI
jgi:hypothetical protein